MENIRGAILMTLAMAGFAIEDMLIKLATTGGMPTGQVVFILGLMGMCTFWLVMIPRRIPLITRKLLEPGVMLRNAGELTGSGCYVMAFTLGALSGASAVMQALPLFVTMGAALFLGQKVGWRRWTAIGTGFLGVMLVLQPGSQNFDPSLLLALLGVIGMSIRDVGTRALKNHIHSLQLAAWGFGTFIFLGPLLMFLMGDAPVAPTALQWFNLFACVAIGTGAYYMLIVASRIGDVAVIAPYRFTRIVFAIAIGFIVFHEGKEINALMIVGVLIIITSGIYTFYRESRTRRASLS